MILSHSIQAPTASVFPYFADLKKFGEAHPLLYQVDKLSEKEYLFYEKITFWGIPFKFNYPVTLVSTTTNQQVIVSSQVQRGVFLYLTFDFKESNGTTEITETVNLKALPPIKAIFLPLLKKSHIQLVEKIKGELKG